ncbi:MAG TPA: hypothetical protein VLO30_05355 [Chthoniobacterales bacterium]|nr:hypothetical protein [Chthoniobacterales bacterium]
MKTLLLVGGLLHFVILIASALTPRVLDWRSNLAALDPFLRRLFWVYGGFIVLVIVSFGGLTLLHAGELASGTPLSRTICAVIAIFWLARLGVQLFVFDPRGFLTTTFLRLGYHGLTLLFTALVFIYGSVGLNLHPL